MRYDLKKMESAQGTGSALLFAHDSRLFAAFDSPTPSAAKARFETWSGVLVECISYAEGRRILEDTQVDFVLVGADFLKES
jgi:hypothetical protein